MCFCFLCVPCLSFASVQTVGVSSVPLQCLFVCFSVVSGFSQAWFLKDNCCLALVKCQCQTTMILKKKPSDEENGLHTTTSPLEKHKDITTPRLGTLFKCLHFAKMAQKSNFQTRNGRFFCIAEQTNPYDL